MYNMNKILTWLKDSNHTQHLVMCLFIALGACIIADGNALRSILSAIYTVAVVGVAVEYIQQKMGGKFDLQDLLADGIGAALGISIYLLKLI